MKELLIIIAIVATFCFCNCNNNISQIRNNNIAQIRNNNIAQINSNFKTEDSLILVWSDCNTLAEFYVKIANDFTKAGYYNEARKFLDSARKYNNLDISIIKERDSINAEVKKLNNGM